MSVRVAVGPRLHFGFLNLSLARERLYGSLGVALDGPRVEVSAAPADGVDCDHARARPHAARACELLGVSGARVAVESELPPHVGLGSGTQLALAVFAAVARAHDRNPTVRGHAPELGRGGRSGVGVATFESGGFVFDAGHPASQFTPERPARGEWTVPPVAARHDTPDDWRFLLVLPDADPGKAGSEEDDSMRSAVEGADPGLADRISAVVTDRVLPAVATGDVDAFGEGVAAVGRLNGAWYAAEQGGVYRPPAGDVIEALDDSPAVAGAGQSSWGPAVYGVTDRGRADAARDAGQRALDHAGVDGRVCIAAPRNTGAAIED
ncbi:beta-ribofuranosylaminobenzene 5'-phosphate synthase family protein [Halobacterium jilantaiense]|uniref:Beta-ribofuranosylaminobenzene 5'-phosphate synthase n=1 Tax=Halobacterium jilantaiense TaxID=355548 RepID=A0A1I0QDP3_9EURY|nr:beta-ribofuranosylaminobenzene 5'-phosphate synthase family protein [Halobacterium jilantaiense]SEW24733.1 beta-ribofuranosylaminobenzene 5'-phosphate synthase [Halobacterium jilantaiense]